MVSGGEPVTYAYKYVPPANNMRPRNRLFHQLLWTDYIFHHPYNLKELKEL